jgi:hypothetical protein
VTEAADDAGKMLHAHGLPPLPRVTPHSLRRTYISIVLLANNFDVKWMMSQVGHADPKMTLDVYAQLEQRAKRDRGASFDRLIRRARDLHVDSPTASEAAQVVLKRSWVGNPPDVTPSETRPSSTKKPPMQEKGKWRDSESNRGQHDFQSVLRIRG